MDKQALIDKAVEDLKGVLPEDGMYLLFCKQRVEEYKAGQYAAGNSARPHESYWDVICTTEKFTQRARELGWINGYKCGVEYPTNGKKPDLPDDVDVDINFANLGNDWHGPSKVGHWKWDARQILRFRIVGERYKPKEPEQQTKRIKDLSDVIFAVSDAISVAVDAGAMPAARELQKINRDLLAKDHAVGVGQHELQAKPDNSWHERGELPPAGTVCDAYDFGHSQWIRVKTLDAKSRDELACATIKDEVYGRLIWCNKFRPIKTERELLIDVIASAGNLSDGILADAIIAAGWSRVSEKSSG